MSGRAPLKGLKPFKNAAHIFAWRHDRFEPAKEPVADDPEAALGPSLAFADALYDQVPRNIGLINCAIGATRIDQWLPDSAPSPKFGFAPFQACTQKMRAARRYGRLVGLLWYQGEWDSFHMRDAEAWPARFETVVRSFREEAGNRDLPVIFTQIGPMPKDKHSARAHLIELQGRIKIAHGMMVSAADLPFQQDGLHLDQTGQLLLGARYASAMAKLYPGDQL